MQWQNKNAVLEAAFVFDKINKLKEKELQKLAFQVKKQRQKIEVKRDEMTKKKYWVT